MWAYGPSRAWGPFVILKFFTIREFKKFPLFFFFLFFTILLGSLGLSGIHLVSQEVRSKLASRANELLTSDFAVSARRQLSLEEKASLESIMGKIPNKTYQIYDVYSMVTHLNSGQTRLVEIRATEGDFPFYGEIRLAEGSFNPDKFLISQDLSDLWFIGIGDELQIGEIKVRVEGIVTEDSSLGLRGFSLAPRLYLPMKNLQESGLLKEGSTGSFARHFKLNLDESALKELKSKIYDLIPDTGVKVVLPEDSSEQTGRVIGIISNFMSLAALIGLILSLVGVFYLYQSHLLARLKDLCLLNLHGLSKGAIVLGIVGQFSLIFLLVFGLLALIISLAYSVLQPSISGALGINLGDRLDLISFTKQLPFLYGLSFAILVPLLFGLMRTQMGLMLKAAKISMGQFRFYDFLPFLITLWLFSCYLSNSWKIGNIFFLGLMIIFFVSTLFVRFLQFTLRKIIGSRGLLLPTLEAGIALRNLTRSGHKLTLSFLSLAMGATLISLILQLDLMIQKEFLIDDKKPGLFIFDIQDDQIDALVDFAEKKNTPLAAITPMIRARLEKVNGQKYVRKKSSLGFRDNRNDDEENRARNTGVNLTYRQDLSPAEKIVAGQPFPGGLHPSERKAFISIEKRWSERMGIDLGDEVVFDIQGVEIEGTIHNIREVKWTSFYPNFFINVEPGFIDEAPKTYLAVLPAGFRDVKKDFQREAVGQFPNISFIDVEELVTKLSLLFEKSRQAIEFISMLSLGVGLVILYGLSHDQVYRRYYDLALMKTLGLSSDRLRLQLVIEFGLLFFSALGLGLGLGWLIAQLIGKEVFKLGFSIDWMRLLIPGLSLTILCLATILLTSWRTVRARPRELLSDS
jgi:putative ABC transport system permease protein